MASFLIDICLQKLGYDAELIVNEFDEMLFEELSYALVFLQILILLLKT